MKLINMFNWVESLISFFTLSFGGGGGGPQQSTTYTSNIPEYAQPFYEEGMRQAGKQIFNTDSLGNVTGIKPMPKYTGERIAGFTPEQLAIQQEVAGLQTPEEFNAAQTNLAGSSNLAGMAGGVGLLKALSYNPQQAYAQQVGVQGFSPEAAAYYMDPYQQAVTDIAVRETEKQGALQKQANALGAINRGTFGGARQALMQAEQDRNLMQSIGDIRAKGAQGAYQNAQQQFNADIARQLQAQQANQQAGLTAQQLTQQGQTAAAQLAGQTGIAGLTSGIDAAKSQAAVAAAEQTANLERLKTQATSAEEKQALQQQINDIKYQTYMEQQNWQKAQLEWFNSMLRGTPGLASTVVQYGAPNSPLQSVGLGLQGLSLMKAMG